MYRNDGKLEGQVGSLFPPGPDCHEEKFVLGQQSRSDLRAGVSVCAPVNTNSVSIIANFILRY